MSLKAELQKMTKQAREARRKAEAEKYRSELYAAAQGCETELLAACKKAAEGCMVEATIQVNERWHGLTDFRRIVEERMHDVKLTWQESDPDSDDERVYVTADWS